MTMTTTTRSTMRIRSSARARIVLSVVALLAVLDGRLDTGAASDPARARRRPDRGRAGAGGRGVPPAGRADRASPTCGSCSISSSCATSRTRARRRSRSSGTSRTAPTPTSGRAPSLLERVRELGEVDRVDARRHRGHALPRGADHRPRRAQGHVRGDRRPRARARRGLGGRAVALGVALAMLGGRRARVPGRRARARAAARRSARPRARSSRRSDLTRRIEVTGDDEIAELGRHFNAMLDRLEQAFALQREFVSRRRPRAAHADHDHPRPPRAARRRPRSARDVALVTDELDRMSRFVEDLLTLAKAERPDFLLARSSTSTC